MTVYVDDYRVDAQVGPLRERWSHLMADSVAELLEFADLLGLDRRWLQDKRSGVHFDVTDPTRTEAIRLGAVPLRCRSDEWRRVVEEARQQHSGPRFPRRLPPDAVGRA